MAGCVYVLCTYSFPHFKVKKSMSHNKVSDARDLLDLHCVWDMLVRRRQQTKAFLRPPSDCNSDRACSSAEEPDASPVLTGEGLYLERQTC